MIVSKLKVKPFHKVNSPLEAPVNSRFPSGVHFKSFIGDLNLLVDVCTNFVATQAFGVVNCTKVGSKLIIKFWSGWIGGACFSIRKSDLFCWVWNTLY